ncbi:MAG: hypothetical protein M3N31_07095 [Actinomycetota bacterium]|nr:hypothetical protein [Actinomycetota bacterium]
MKDLGDAELARLRARITDLGARLKPASERRQREDEAPPRGERPRWRWREEVAGLVVLFVVTRVVLAVIGVVSRELVPGHVARPDPLGVGPSFSSFSFLDIWGEWDSSWYLSIAEYGYKAVPLEGPFANYAFFPLFPLLSRWVGWLVGGPYIGGLVVANAAFVVACVFLYRLVAIDDGAGTARRSVKYLFAAPAAFLFSAMLSESLYLALAVMCFYFARTRRWWAVGVAGFLLALSRAPGVLVVIPLLWMYMAQRRFSLRRVRPDVLWLALFPAGVCVFMWVNEVLTGDALAFARIQTTAWGHRLRDPVSSLWGSLTGDDLFWRLNAWYVVAVLVFTVVFVRRFSAVYLVFVVVSLVPPMSTSVWYSMIRYTAVIFPLYVVAARVTDSRPRLDQALTVASGLLQGFLMSQWVNNSLLVV